MNSCQFNKNICRICLEDNMLLDWNTPLYRFNDTTYKDCYYKYSQLERSVTDPFSQMLCQDCSTALQNTHSLILKALESNKLFQDEFNGQLIEEFKTPRSNSQDSDINFTPAEFETVLVEYDEDLVEDIMAFNVLEKSYQQAKGTITASKKVKPKAKTEHLKDPSNKSLELNASPPKANEMCTSKIISGKIVRDNMCKIIVEAKTSEQEKSKGCKSTKHDLINSNKTMAESKTATSESNVKMKKKERELPRMCSICSKILHNKYALQWHEKTHIENRERKETCKVCGLKFFDKRNLYCHMRVHKENREKRHKCEFCSKAFYDKGGLNIHLRIHLGQMIPCTLCSKQFFRQIDLDRHMNTHSATAINSETKKKLKYYVRCKYCNKSILSTSFKSHTASHLNDPLMKCLICGKEYFRRESCVNHVKKIHQKSNEEYNDFIEILNKNRVSHLFLEQNTDIRVTND